MHWYVESDLKKKSHSKIVSYRTIVLPYMTRYFPVASFRTSVGLNPNIMDFELDRSNFELSRTRIHPPKLKFEPFPTPPKSPNFEPFQPETG